MSFCEGSPCGPTWRAPRRALGGRVPFSAQGSVFIALASPCTERPYRGVERAWRYV